MIYKKAVTKVIKEKFLSKNSIQNEAWKLVPGPFLYFKEVSVPIRTYFDNFDNTYLR